MLNSQWLDIATGVVLTWFLFALGVSAVNEGLAKILAVRSKQLWAALRQMLDGTEKPQGILRNLVGMPRQARPSSPYPAANAPNVGPPVRDPDRAGPGDPGQADAENPDREHTRVRLLPRPDRARLPPRKPVQAASRGRDQQDRRLIAGSPPGRSRPSFRRLWPRRAGTSPRSATGSRAGSTAR